MNFRGDGEPGEIAPTPVAEGTPEAAVLTAEAGAQRAILTWTHPGDSSITKWQYQQRAGEAEFRGEWKNIPDSSAATRGYTVRELPGEVAHGFRVRAVNEAGFGAPSNEARAVPPQLSVEREQQVVKQSLAAVGQATLAGVTNVIDERLKATPGTSGLMLGGELVGGTATNMDLEASRETADWWQGNRASESFNRPIDDAGMLDGSAFTLSLSGEEAGAINAGWTVWGRGDYRSFEGSSGEDSWNGSVKSAWLGIDTWTSEQMLAGLAVSRNRGEIDLMTDEIGTRVETTLTAAWPYMQMTMPSGTGTVRVVLGAG